jgi:hypothetical protein
MGKNFALDFDLRSQYGRDFDKWLHELTAVEVDDRPQTAKEGIAQLGSADVVSAAKPMKPRFSVSAATKHLPLLAAVGSAVAVGIIGYPFVLIELRRFWEIQPIA